MDVLLSKKACTGIFWTRECTYFCIRPPSWIWQLWRIAARKCFLREYALIGKKMGQGGGAGEGKIFLSAPPPPRFLCANPLLVKPLRWLHQKPYLLSHLPLQNNTYTAGYLTTLLAQVDTACANYCVTKSRASNQIQLGFQNCICKSSSQTQEVITVLLTIVLC